MMILNQIKKIDWLMLIPGMHQRIPRRLLAIEFQEGNLCVAAFKRTDGKVVLEKTAYLPLSLNITTDEPLLVAQEIKRQLESAGIRYRQCIVCLPMRWVLSFSLNIPKEVPDEDIMSFCELEATRELPYPPETLHLSYLVTRVTEHDRICAGVGVLRSDVQRLQSILELAGLIPRSFTSGLAVLKTVEESLEPKVVLYPTAETIGIVVLVQAGVLALRVIEGIAQIDSDLGHVIRELRLTLAQYPPPIVQNLRKVQIYGHDQLGKPLAEELKRQLSGEYVVEVVTHFREKGEDLEQFPAKACVAHGLTILKGRRIEVEFLPPRISPIEQFINNYLAGRFLKIGVAVGALVLLVGLLFLAQELRLIYWSKKWASVEPQVRTVEYLQQQIKKYRPWFDDSLRTLMILKRLSEAFPEDGTVSVRTIEMRDTGLVICSGTARDNASLLRVLERLRGIREIASVHVDQTRGNSPVQFTFRFEWIAKPQQSLRESK